MRTVIQEKISLAIRNAWIDEEVDDACACCDCIAESIYTAIESEFS